MTRISRILGASCQMDGSTTVRKPSYKKKGTVNAKTLHTRTLLKRDLSSLPQETFQFRSNGKAQVNLYRRLLVCGCCEFQFPSNGKARVNCEEGILEEVKALAQFQFRSNGKARVNLYRRLLVCGCCEFQFPSNGKVYSEKRRGAIPSPSPNVSIPFKRESVFRALPNRTS